MKQHPHFNYRYVFSLALSLFTWQALAQDNLPFQSLFKTEKGNEVACYRIPALVTAPNGDLIAAIDERVPSCGDLKWNRNINLVIRRSTNNGQSWLPIEKIIDYPDGQSASDPSMIVDEQTGEIFLFFNFMDLDKEKDVYYLKYIKSTDNGKTWSEPIDITQQITKPTWHKDFQFITSGRGFQADNGDLLHTLVNLDKGVYIFGSKDHGTTWFVNENPLTPADESKIIALKENNWIVNSRVNKSGLRYVHTSTDSGNTWQSFADSSLIDPGCNASFIIYPAQNGYPPAILFSNAESEKERENLTIKVSYDNGKSWTTGKKIYKGAAAYSSMTVLKNGDIGIFFEKDEYSDNVFYSISAAWLFPKNKR